MAKTFKKILAVGIMVFSLSGCALFAAKYEPYDVSPAKLEDYKLNETEIKIDTGETFQLKATIGGNDIPFDIKWRSDDKSVATVSSKGVVKGVSGGYAQVYAVFTKDIEVSCMVYCTGQRKTPVAKGALGKFFTKYGNKIEAYLNDTHIFNKYKFRHTEFRGDDEYWVDLYYMDEKSLKRQFQFEVMCFKGDMTYATTYEFKDTNFFDCRGTLQIYNKLHSVNCFIELDSLYYEKDTDTTIKMVSGKELPVGENGVYYDATEEEKIFTLNLLNEAIAYMYELKTQYKGSFKLF